MILPSSTVLRGLSAFCPLTVRLGGSLVIAFKRHLNGSNATKVLGDSSELGVFNY